MHPLPAIRRAFLIIAGLAAVVAGAIGIVVPLLPTTPFLLLAAVCFVRSPNRPVYVASPTRSRVVKACLSFSQ
jgi:uncharacterized membrane protein YbaN (DUF454 family)